MTITGRGVALPVSSSSSSSLALACHTIILLDTPHPSSHSMKCRGQFLPSHYNSPPSQVRHSSQIIILVRIINIIADTASVATRPQTKCKENQRPRASTSPFQRTSPTKPFYGGEVDQGGPGLNSASSLEKDGWFHPLDQKNAQSIHSNTQRNKEVPIGMGAVMAKMRMQFDGPAAALLLLQGYCCTSHK